MISAGQKVLFAGHGWHAVEIVGVAVVSLAAIWLFEALFRKPHPKDAGRPRTARRPRRLRMMRREDEPVSAEPTAVTQLLPNEFR